MNAATLTGIRNLATTVADADHIRRIVVEYMHYDGASRHRLTDQQWAEVYCLADGFGTIDMQFANEQCWDWSHVRDSSVEGFNRMWQGICDRVSRKPIC